MFHVGMRLWSRSSLRATGTLLTPFYTPESANLEPRLYCGDVIDIKQVVCHNPIAHGHDSGLTISSIACFDFWMV